MRKAEGQFLVFFLSKRVKGFKAFAIGKDYVMKEI